MNHFIMFCNLRSLRSGRDDRFRSSSCLCRSIGIGAKGLNKFPLPRV